MAALKTPVTALRQSAFTLVELMVAIAIVGLLLAVTVPSSMRFYESMQYRQAVRDVLSTLGSARQQAMDRGSAQDVLFDANNRRITYGDETMQLPKGFELSVTTAGEVNRGNLGAIRFYPEGSSTGGDVEIRSPVGKGVRITVDWLMGGVRQVAYDAQ